MGPGGISDATPTSALAVFRRSCGLPSGLVLRCEDTDRPESLPLGHRFETPFVLIGRGADSDFVLDDARVSRRHALIQAISGGLFCFDLQSRTQIRWEPDDRARAAGWLTPDEAIRIGPFRILGETSATADTPAAAIAEGGDPFEHEPAVALGEAGLPGVELELPIQSGSSRGGWRMKGTLALVGRSDDCQLVLSDESVSRLHGYFLRTSAGLWVVDLKGRQGIYVNGNRIRWAWLDGGDVVKFGPFAFKVRYDGVGPPIGRADVPLSAGGMAESSDDESRSRALVPRTRAGRSLRPGSRSGGREVMPVPRAAQPNFELVVQPAPADAIWQPAIDPSYQQMMMWRQQMQAMETFHQDMILMVQMFAAMHREHMQSVRDELDQVRRLTRELEHLQRRLEVTPGERPAADPGLRRRAADAGGGPDPSETRPQRHQTNARSSKAKAKPARPEVSGPNGTSSPAGPPRTPPKPGAASDQPPAPDDLTMHTALCRRIAEIQKERQGYWKRILGAMNK